MTSLPITSSLPPEPPIRDLFLERDKSEVMEVPVSAVGTQREARLPIIPDSLIKQAILPFAPHTSLVKFSSVSKTAKILAAESLRFRTQITWKELSDFQKMGMGLRPGMFSSLKAAKSFPQLRSIWYDDWPHLTTATSETILMRACPHIAKIRRN